MGWEIGLSRQQSAAQTAIADHLSDLGDDIKKAIDISSDHGDVVLALRKIGRPEPPIKLYEADRTTHLLRIPVGAETRLTTFDEPMSSLNLNEYLAAIHAKAEPGR